MALRLQNFRAVTEKGLFMHAIGLLLATATGIFIGKRYWSDTAESKKGFEKNFTGAFPRNSGAKSAVTGGDPEDMNGMPIAEELEKGPKVSAKRSTSSRRSKRSAS